MRGEVADFIREDITGRNRWRCCQSIDRRQVRANTGMSVVKCVMAENVGTIDKVGDTRERFRSKEGAHLHERCDTHRSVRVSQAFGNTSTAIGYGFHPT